MPSLHRKLTRSASVTPPINVPSSNVSDWLNSQDGLLRDNRVPTTQPAEPHAPLSPQSSVTSSGSGSDTQQQQHDNPHHVRNTFLEDASGMKGTSGSSHFNYHSILLKDHWEFYSLFNTMGTFNKFSKRVKHLKNKGGGGIHSWQIQGALSISMTDWATNHRPICYLSIVNGPSPSRETVMLIETAPCMA